MLLAKDRIKQINNRLVTLKMAVYNPANETYKLPNGEFMARIAWRSEKRELELERDRIIEKRKYERDNSRRWLNGGDADVA